ncbi:PAS domain-containing protein [Daldinia decipiens]|uniref:PAS domain-containing protein n=1 Tax=Daldinia decipiens TaxID=326647 RepID=UPI0020C22BB4|nr:PAS domain-containing protein [Daldinia decipiens]KAI1659415.1 PAS domain-containing protein [Daldinia decipiens]
MDNFFGNRLSQEELQRRHSLQRNQRRLVANSLNQPAQQPQYSHVPVTATNADPSLVGANSLDDMICSNSHELERRRSLPQQFPGQMSQVDADRRMSMMEFGGGDDSFRDYQFGAMSNSADAMHNGFPTLNTNIPLHGTSGFTSPAMLANDFSALSPDMVGNMIAFSNMNMESMNADPSMNMFSSATAMSTPFPSNSMDGLPADFSMDLSSESSALGAMANNPGAGMPVDTGNDSIMTNSPQFASPSQTNTQTNIGLDTTMNGFQPNISPQPIPQVRPQTLVSSTPSYESPIATTTGTTPESAPPSQPSIPAVINPQHPKEKTIYSKSGFDMLRALWLVATRKNPQVNLGAVDMSCAFVVCDVTMNDCPIIYVSDNFQNLTGYSQHDIVGQNCRFLQAPDGKVEAGTKREFVDNGAVYNLKQKIAEGKEVQQSLINYRKGGKPFLNLLTMIPIPWDTSEIRYIIGFQIDLVECPDAIASHQGPGTMKVNYKHSDIGQYIWTPPSSSQWEPENGQTLGVDDVSTLLQQFNPKGSASDWHRQSWDKMLLENTDDVVHVLSLKGLFLYLSPSCKRILEYDATELVGNSISSISHPSDIVPVTRELKDATNGNSVNIVFRIRRKQSGYTWFESHGSLFVEQGKGRKCIILVGRKRPVFTLSRRELEFNGGIGDSELWTKLSTSGMFLFVSANVRSLLDLQPENLVGTSIQELMRKESRAEFGRSIEKARRGRIVTCKHEVQNRRGQVLQAHTIMYPGDASKGQKPTFLLAQTKLVKASSRAIGPVSSTLSTRQSSTNHSSTEPKPTSSFAVAQGIQTPDDQRHGLLSAAAGGGMAPGNQDKALASDDNIFDELKTTRCTSWQYELRQMEKVNRVLAEELHGLLSNKKKRKRRKGIGNFVRDCANCHTRNTPEWRRGPSGQRDLCNSCGLRWAKQTGRVSPRNSSRGGNGDGASKKSNSPVHSSPLQREVPTNEMGVIEQPSETGASTTANRSSGSNVVTSTGGANTTPSNSRVFSMPPPSLSLLGGGVVGSEMTAIQEEREVSM